MAKSASDKGIINNQFNKLNDSLKKASSKEEEIKLIEDFRNDLLTKYNRGKKIRIKVNGERICISKTNVNLYKTLTRMIHERKSNLNKKTPIHDLELDGEIILFRRLLRELEKIKSAIYRSPFLSEQYKSIVNIINDNKVRISEKNSIIRDFINQNLVIINFLNGKVNENAEEIRAIDDVSFNDLRGYNEKPVEKKIVKVDVEEDDDEKEIINNRKNKKRRSLFKKIGASVAAAVVLLFGTFITKTVSHNVSNAQDRSAVSETKENNNENKQITSSHKSNKKISVKKKTTKSNKKVVKKSNKVNKIITKSNISVKSSVKKYLGSKFKVKKSGKVYSNMYNSINRNDGLRPYYGYDSVREVVGCGIRCGSSLTTFVDIGNNNYEVCYDNNSKCMSSKDAEKLISSLVKKGGKVESLASRSSFTNSGIEGYYNYDDVKILQKK